VTPRRIASWTVAAAQQGLTMLPGVHGPAGLPPITPGEFGVGPRTPGDVIVPVLPIPGEMLEPVDELPNDGDPGAEPTLPIDDDPGCGEPTLPIADDPGAVEPTLPIADDPGAGDPTLPIEDDPTPGAPMMDVPAPGVVPNVPVVPAGAAVCAKHTGAAASSAAASEDMELRLSMTLSFEWKKG
jgi:hypothetical protein